MKQKLLLLAAVFFGVLAFILTFQQINSERAKIQATMQEVALLELKEDVAQGVYCNFAVISHSSSEFVMDLIRMLPGMPKAQVQSRVILTPEHAVRLMHALQDNITRYEQTFGPIRIPEQGKGTYVPRLSDFKGEA